MTFTTAAEVIDFIKSQDPSIVRIELHHSASYLWRVCHPASFGRLSYGFSSEETLLAWANNTLVPLVEKFTQPGQHPDDLAVDRFAAAMKKKLADKRAQGRFGWETCPPKTLSEMLKDHVYRGDPVDVANFCMMLHQRGFKI